MLDNLTILLTAYYLSKCVRDDPEINTCLKNSANRLAKFLRQGVPELDIDEVCLPFIFVSQLYKFAEADSAYN